MMPAGFRAAVDGVVFGAGGRFKVFGIVALKALDEGNAAARGEKGVFAVGFLAAAPAGIAKDVDVRGIEIEPEMLARIALMFGGVVVVLGAAFRGDGVGFVVDEGGIPGGGHRDRLGKNGRDPGAGDAMEAFVAMAVGGKAQARDGRRIGLK